VVTVDEGMFTPMETLRFRTWVQRHVTTYQVSGGYDKESTMGVEVAATVLKTDDFLAMLPRLDGVAPVRMPVMVEGLPCLLKPGYDAGSRLFCEDSVPYDVEMSLEDALKVFDKYLCDFDFPEGKWNESRSGSVQVAAMLGTFCRWIFPPGTIRPQVIYTANQPGAGKSLLVAMVLSIIEGMGAATAFPLGGRGGSIDDGKLSEILAMTARNREATLWLDDAPQWIKSNALNEFVTSPRHKGRTLGSANKFDEEAVTQVFMTGNMIEVTPDLLRRSLLCELFTPGDVADKKPVEILSAKKLSEKPRRAELLAACWSLVRNWVVNEMPKGMTGPPGFEEWCQTMGGMLVAAGLPDPGTKPDLPMSGDTQEKDFRELFVSFADRLALDDDESDFDITPDQVVEEGRSLEILIDLIGYQGDDILNSKDKRRLGMQLKKWRGRQFRDTKGRLFEFGQRKARTGSVYPIRFL